MDTACEVSDSVNQELEISLEREGLTAVDFLVEMKLLFSGLIRD